MLLVSRIPGPVESDTPCPSDSFCQLADNLRGRRSLLQDDDDEEDQPWTVTKWLIYTVDIQVRQGRQRGNCATFALAGLA